MGMKDEIFTQIHHYRNKNFDIFSTDGLKIPSDEIISPMVHVYSHAVNVRCHLCKESKNWDANWGSVDGTPYSWSSDPVNHPDHYTAGGIETIDFLQAKLGDGFEHYLAGNIIKYITRYRHKNGVEDLKKAQWYLTKLIEVKSNENS